MTIKEYLITHNMCNYELAKMLGVSNSKLSHVIHYHQRPNKLMLEGFAKLGIDFQVRDCDYMNSVKQEKIERLLRENAELRAENKQLRALIHNRLDTCLERLTSAIHHKAKLRKYNQEYPRRKKTT